MTVGALIVYISPTRFTQDRANYHLALDSFLLAIPTPLSFLSHIVVHFAGGSALGFGSMGLTYSVMSVPSIFSSMAVCLTLTKLPSAVSTPYAYLVQAQSGLAWPPRNESDGTLDYENSLVTIFTRGGR